jgi:hypothetical protein
MAVERALKAVGVTEHLVERIAGRPCGCRARKGRMTRWGYRQQERIERLLNKAAEFYGLSD